MTNCVAGQWRHEILDSIVVSIPACHAGDPGSIPGRGVLDSIVEYPRLSRGRPGFLRFLVFNGLQQNMEVVQ